MATFARDTPSACARQWTPGSRKDHARPHARSHSSVPCGEDPAEVFEVLSKEPDSIFLWHDPDHLAGLLRGIAFMDLPGR